MRVLFSDEITNANGNLRLLEALKWILPRLNAGVKLIGYHKQDYPPEGYFDGGIIWDEEDVRASITMLSDANGANSFHFAVEIDDDDEAVWFKLRFC